MKTEIGISTQNRQIVADLLNQLLADETVLYIKIRNYHWNIQGPNFYSLHGLFEEHYTQLAIMIDDIAERVRQLGHFALGSMKNYLSITNLTESIHDDLNANTMLINLVNDHETIIRMLRNNILKCEEANEPATADLMTSLVEKHEKMVWMLRSSTI